MAAYIAPGYWNGQGHHQVQSEKRAHTSHVRVRTEKHSNDGSGWSGASAPQLAAKIANTTKMSVFRIFELKHQYHAFSLGNRCIKWTVAKKSRKKKTKKQWLEMLGQNYYRTSIVMCCCRCCLLFPVIDVTIIGKVSPNTVHRCRSSSRLNTAFMLLLLFFFLAFSLWHFLRWSIFAEGDRGWMSNGSTILPIFRHKLTQ